MTYTIPMIPPSNNKYIGRTNIYEYQRVKKAWANAVNICCCPKPEKPIELTEIRITYYFPDNRRRDPDNYSGKMILDGLVRAGIIADDSFKNITLTLCAKCDKLSPRTVIEVGAIEKERE